MKEMIEIWMPVEKGGEAYSLKKSRNLRLVAVLLDGYPIKLDTDWVVEKYPVTKEEGDKLAYRFTKL